mgnify:FL=1
MKEPKIRFKGFSGEWEETPFSETFDFLKNNSLSRAELSDSGEVMNIHYGDVLIKYGECVDVIKEVETFVKDEEVAKKLHQSCAIKNGDVIFADAAEDNTVGKCSEVIANENDAIVSGLHTIACRPKKDFAPMYLGYYLNSNAYHDQLLPHIQGTKISSISKKAISLTEISSPIDKNEQRAIASYFQRLDSLIQSTTKKIESLKQVKAASLQSMFPQEGETTPRVRFKGFEGEWEKKTLGDCLTINNERNQSNVYSINDVLSVSDEVGVVNQIKLLGRSYAGKSVVNYRVLKTNQIVYTKSPLKSKPYGIIKVNKGDIGIVSVLYAVYDANENVYPDYIHYYFEPIHRINNYLLPLINKGAKNTMNISDEMALTGNIWIPSLEEQKKIADFLQALDSQITLQTLRLEKLKQIKAACLDNMFV